MDPVLALRTFGGVAEWHTLERLGVSRLNLNSALASCAVTRVRRGCYALPHADPVRLAEIAWRGEATCITALARMGLPVPEPDGQLHLFRSPVRSESGRNLSTPDDVHWHTGAAPAGDVTAVAHALDTSARCLTALDQLVAIDAALHRRLLLPHDLALFAATPRSRLRWLLRNADARTRSPAETHARVAFRRARIPFEFQVDLSAIGEVDFVIDQRFTLEVDGMAYHSDGRQFVTDRRRDRAAVFAGLTPLRYTAWEAIWRTDMMVAEVWQMIRLAREDDARTRPTPRKSRPTGNSVGESRADPKRDHSEP